jgi:stage II sporulation protein AA (anti-sigma F factor antagonist)
MKYSLSSLPGRGLTLALGGELDINTVDDLRAVFERLVALEVRHIEINLRGLRMIDSLGVGALVGFYKRIRGQGGAVVLSECGGQPMAILRLVHFDRFMMAPPDGRPFLG